MRICMIGEHISDALLGHYLGGAEKQCALLAAQLSQRHHDVYVLDAASSDAETQIGGVTVLGGWCTSHGPRVIRFITHRLPAIYTRVLRLRPDVIYVRGPSLYAVSLLPIAGYCNSRLIWAIASDVSISPEMVRRQLYHRSLYARMNSTFVRNHAAKLLLKRASMVFCQSEEQYAHVKGRRGQVYLVPNIYDGSARAEPSAFSEKRIIWVGRLCGIKGENELLAMARVISPQPIEVFGAVSPQFASSTLYAQIVQQPNLVLRGHVPYHAILQEYKCATCLVNTSPAEGFSNTFLEAWANGCPVFSLNANPNCLLNDRGLGFCAYGDVEALAYGLMSHLEEDEQVHSCMAIRAINYMRNNHSPDRIAELVESIVRKSD